MLKVCKVILMTGLLLILSSVFLPAIHALPVISGYRVSSLADIPRARGVSVDGAGNLYTMDRNSGIVSKITPEGAVSTVADLPDLPEGGYVGPHFDPVSGNLFVSRFNVYDGDQVLKVTLDGEVSVYASGLGAPAGLASDAEGNLYVSQFSYEGIVFKISPSQTIDTFATGLYYPDGLTLNSTGDLFICNTRQYEMLKVPAEGGEAKLFASGFDYPIAATFDREGNLLVAEFLGASLAKITPSGIVASFGNGFNHPDGLAFGQEGNLYIADFGEGKIYKAVPDTTPPPLSLPIISGYTISSFADIPRARDLTLDGDGNLFTIDRDGGTIFKITPGGEVSALADLPDLTGGYVGPYYEPVSGNLFVSRFWAYSGNEVLKITPAGEISTFAAGIPAPAGLTSDADGNLYVSHFENDGTVFKITPGGTVSPFAFGLYYPDGLVFGPDGDLFICNTRQNEIRRVSSDGDTAALFASGLNYPIFATFDRSGNLLVSELLNGTISKVGPDGVVSPFGSGFDWPIGLAFDQKEDLYISDFRKGKIYKAVPEDSSSKGDLNGDGNLTSSDVVMLLNCIFIGQGNCTRTGDMNCNGFMSAVDGVILLNKVFLDVTYRCAP